MFISSQHTLSSLYASFGAFRGLLKRYQEFFFWYRLQNRCHSSFNFLHSVKTSFFQGHLQFQEHKIISESHVRWIWWIPQHRDWFLCQNPCDNQRNMRWSIVVKEEPLSRFIQILSDSATQKKTRSRTFSMHCVPRAYIGVQCPETCDLKNKNWHDFYSLLFADQFIIL